MSDDNEISFIRGKVEGLETSVHSRMASVESNVEKRFSSHHEKNNEFHRMINQQKDKQDIFNKDFSKELADLRAGQQVHYTEQHNLKDNLESLKNDVKALGESMAILSDTIQKNANKIILYGGLFAGAVGLLSVLQKLKDFL